MSFSGKFFECDEDSSCHISIILRLIGIYSEIVGLLVPKERTLNCVDIWDFEHIEETFASRKITASSETIMPIVKALIILTDHHGENLDRIS